MSPGARAGVYLHHMGDNDWEVTNVTTIPDARGRGLQRELWKRILADADRTGACLLLTVGSGRGDMDPAKLYEWYVRLGFHGLAGGASDGYQGTRMERFPGGDSLLEVYT